MSHDEFRGSRVHFLFFFTGVIDRASRAHSNTTPASLVDTVDRELSTTQRAFLKRHSFQQHFRAEAHTQ